MSSTMVQNVANKRFLSEIIKILSSSLGPVSILGHTSKGGCSIALFIYKL